MLLLPRIAQIVTLMLLATLTGVDASAAEARLPRIAIQPVHGAPDLVGASLRAQIAHLVRAQGFRVVSTTASVENTVQYAALGTGSRSERVCDRRSEAVQKVGT